MHDLLSAEDASATLLDMLWDALSHVSRAVRAHENAIPPECLSALDALLEQKTPEAATRLAAVTPDSLGDVKRAAHCAALALEAFTRQDADGVLGPAASAVKHCALAVRAVKNQSAQG